jgi:hypothetical protein
VRKIPISLYENLLPILISNLNSGNAKMRHRALELLAMLEVPPESYGLVRYFTDTDARVQSLAMRLCLKLEKMPWLSNELVAKHLGDKDASVRTSAIKLLWWYF